MPSRRAWMVRRSNPVGRAGARLDGRGGACAIRCGLPLGRAALGRWRPSRMADGGERWIGRAPGSTAASAVRGSAAANVQSRLNHDNMSKVNMIRNHVIRGNDIMIRKHDNISHDIMIR